MAEASCSGTTPFKRLVDHQARDTGHHQDRLVDRSALGAHASFRSAPGPAPWDGYGAFVAGSSSPAASALPHDAADRLAAHAAALQPPVTRAAPDVSNWAADFGRFASQLPQPQHVVAPEPPATMTQTPLGFQAAAWPARPAWPSHAHSMTAGIVPHAPPAESDFDREMVRWVSAHGGGAGAGDMRHVDAAMEQVARELDLHEAALPEASEAAVPDDRSAARLTDLETPEIGNLSLHEPAAPPARAASPQPAPRAKSAISEAAERLLETVQHEDGDKWHNSVFLSLMRDFRDGRKDIVDNQIQHTGAGST